MYSHYYTELLDLYSMLYLNLPQNNYELTGYIVAAAFALLVRIVLGIVVDWSSQYQRQFVWGITLIVFAFSVWAVWFLNGDEVSCGYNESVEVYLERKREAIGQVEYGSDVWYNLSTLESFKNADMPCEVKGEVLSLQNKLLDSITRKYNLK